MIKKISWFVLINLLFCSQTFANSWTDLWLRHDQQAASLLHNGDPRHAAELFTQPAWQGVAQYRAGDYEKTLAAFNSNNNATAHYNRGNALAHLGEYHDAIAAYDQALKLAPKMADAKFNRDLLEKLLQQQQQQSSSQQSSQNNSQNDAKDKSQNNQQNSASSNSQSQNNSAQNQQNPSDKSSSQNQSTAPQQNSQDDSQQANNKEQLGQKEDDAQQKDAKQQQSAADKPQPISTEQREQQQAMDQWLSRVPDEPGGLLKQIFLRDHLRRQASNN